MMLHNIFNDAKTYSYNISADNEMAKMPEKAAFAIQSNEVIESTLLPREYSTVDDIMSKIDDLDIAIVEEIARSKYLNSLQIFDMLTMRGFVTKRENLRRRILKLMHYRVIRENIIKRNSATNGLRYYEIELKGYIIAMNRGVSFHSGNCYISYKKKLELGKIDSIADVKRILAGNMIAINGLKNGLKIERFGIMESFYVENEDGVVKDGSIFRTAATIKIDEESVLAYEVVRNTEESYEKLADKVKRYYTLLHNANYLNSNNHLDKVYPQLIICGESTEHNRKIVAFLKEQNLWSDDDTLLFTEDLLNIKDSVKSIYEFKGNDRIWYKLPLINKLSTKESA